MIEIEVNKKKILLTGKAKIKLTYRNYNFEDAFANKVVSMPFEAPLHGINLEIFGFENIPNFETFFTDGSATIFYKSIPFLQGKIQILSNNRSTIKLSFFEETDFVDLPDKNVNEINLGGNRTLAADVAGLLTYAKDNLPNAYPTVDFNFPPIYNPKFLPESVTEFSKVLNRFGTKVAEVFPQNSLDFPRADCLVPQPFLMYVIKQIFSEIGFTIAGDFVDDVDANKLMLYANHALDSKEVITLNPEDAKMTRTTDTPKVSLDESYTYGDAFPAEEAEIDLPFIPGDFFEVSENSTRIFFDNDSTDGNFDNSNLYSPTDRVYQVKTTKKHTIRYRLQLDEILFENSIATDAANVDLKNFYIYAYVKIGDTIAINPADSNSIIEGEFFVEKLKADMYLELEADGTSYIIDKTFDFIPADTDIDRYLSINVSVWRLEAPTGLAKFFKRVDHILKAGSFWEIDVDPDVYNLNSYNPVYNMQNSVPIIKCKDFMKEIKNTLNLAFAWDYENKICYLNYFDNILQNSDLINYSNKAEFNFDKKQKSYTVNGLKYEFPANDVALNYLNKENIEYNIENATNVIVCKATPIGYVYQNSRTTNGSFALIPWIEESGNSGFDGSTTNNRQNIRLMYWRGAQPDSEGTTYYKALAFNFDVDGNPTTEPHLAMNGADGIVAKYYTNYMKRFNNSAEFSRRFLLNIIDIKNLNTNDTWLVDYGKYTLKQLDVEIGENIEPAEATLLKID